MLTEKVTGEHENLNLTCSVDQDETTKVTHGDEDAPREDVETTAKPVQEEKWLPRMAKLLFRKLASLKLMPLELPFRKPSSRRTSFRKLSALRSTRLVLSLQIRAQSISLVSVSASESSTVLMSTPMLRICHARSVVRDQQAALPVHHVV